MRPQCKHTAGWAHPAQGESRCKACGVVRFADYGALRPAGLPSALTPKPRDARRADRAAATRIANLPRRTAWWGLTTAA
ncbi:DUF6255 family natural product biosynthesis protein [Streptomyces hiroshimensis]|uniref:Uncharacterized protein n=1 Tax=Streptomyces hiroshimensis TaxID=66424 RepID=A0ABQ2Y670_9ACTN|nr:hypothetical protein GCM10010324_12470 [Streptomyces hiroshimensis]